MHRYVIFIAFAVLLAFAPANGRAQVDLISREAELKARMLVLLLKFVTWPAASAPSSANPMKIGIVGDDPFVDDNGESHLQVPNAKILRFATAADLEDCHVLVVSKTADFKKVIEKTMDKPILVVSESPNLARQGAVINLLYDPAQQNKIRLEINPTTATRLNLVIDRNLLRSPAVEIVRAG